MEDIRASRLGNRAGTALASKIPNGAPKTAFGAPPVAAGIDDYADIFGGLDGSFSIPVLDLPPPAIYGYDPPIDYSEIFGALNGGSFAPSYEELVAEQKRMENATSIERVPEETCFDQQVTEVSELPSEWTNEDHLTCSENDQISSNSHYSNVSKQHNVPYHRISQGGKVGTMNGTTLVTQPHDFSGSTFVAEACPPLQNMKIDRPPVVENNNLSLNGDLKVERAEGRQGEISIQTSYCGGSKDFEDDLKDDPKHFTTKSPASEDGPADVKHHSRSSSYHSTSSGDISYPDYTFLTVSDVSLQTQPLPIPPPSRPPPKVNITQGHSEVKISTISKVGLDEGSPHKRTTKHQTYGGGVYKHHALQVSMKNSSPHFFDVEVDAISAAAAMKEAMEQAQARLKSAKELMERKKDNLQSCKRLGQHDVAICRERKGDRVAQEVKSYSEETTKKTLENEKRQKTAKASKIAPDCEEKGTYLVLTEEARQTMQGKESRSSRLSNKPEQRNDEWKVDKQFYELINNEKKFTTVQELSEQEGFEKKLIYTTMTKEKENESEVSKLVHEFKTVQEVSEQECLGKPLKAIAKGNNNTQSESQYKGSGKLFTNESCEWDANVEELNSAIMDGITNESCEWDGNVKELKYAIMAGREEEIREILEAIPEVYVQEENENEQKEDPVSCVPEENENKLEEALEFCQQDENGNKPKEKKSNFAEVVHIYKDENKKLKANDENCKVEEVNESEEEEKKPIAVKEARECLESGEESNAAYVTFEPDMSKKLKLVNKVGRQDEIEGDVKLFSESCVNEVEKMKAAQEASQCEKLVLTGEPTHLACNPEVHAYELKGSSVTIELEESKHFTGTQEAFKWKRNDKKIKVTQEALALEENEKKLKAAQEAGWDTVNGKEKEEAKEASERACNEKKAGEGQLGHHQNENKQKASQAPSKLENCENKLTADEREQRQRENDYIREVQATFGLEKKDRGLNGDREVYQGIKNHSLEAVQQAILLEDEGNKLNPSLDASESCIRRKTENTTADMRKEDEREKEEIMKRERKQEMEHLKKLEEEKEREREREKDRLAVEKATREDRERAFAEARERAERLVVERVTAEARQRALAEAREKAEKASAEAKSLAEKASREARLRAERAAVERATAEARERAVERAIAEKAAAEARERTERPAAIFKDRMKKDNEAEGYCRPTEREDSGTRLKPTFDVRDVSHDALFQSAASYSNKSFEGGESALRCKARLERHQRTFERAAKALAEKNMRDILAQREKAERNRLAESLDADVRRWSNGKEGNLRALLSTLQYILGPESGWQPIPLTDVITSAAVKKAYRKATLYVHPDKLQQRGAGIQQKYICEKVFDLLKEAWNRFNSEER